MTALDMFASAPNLCLLRTIAIGSEAVEERGSRRSNNTFVSSVASAVFWPHDTGASPDRLERDTAAEVATGNPDTRTLRGELYVPKGSKQSFTFPRFDCSVSEFSSSLPKICFGSPAQAETIDKQTVFHCLSSSPGGWFRPLNCARGSTSH